MHDTHFVNNIVIPFAKLVSFPKY